MEPTGRVDCFPVYYRHSTRGGPRPSLPHQPHHHQGYEGPQDSQGPQTPQNGQRDPGFTRHCHAGSATGDWTIPVKLLKNLKTLIQIYFRLETLDFCSSCSFSSLLRLV